MTGRTCAGTWVTGTGRTASRARPTSTTSWTTSRRCASTASQAVVWQTAINPVVALELLDEGVWKGTGVLGPEAFPPKPFLERLAELGSPHGQIELPHAGRAEGPQPLRSRRRPAPGPRRRRLLEQAGGAVSVLRAKNSRK